MMYEYQVIFSCKGKLDYLLPKIAKGFDKLIANYMTFPILRKGMGHQQLLYSKGTLHLAWMD